MKKHLRLVLVLMSLVVAGGLAALAAVGPRASQITVSTTSWSTLAPSGTNLQNTLDWLDSNVMASASSYLLITNAQATYGFVNSNNTWATSTTNSFDHTIVRSRQTVNASGLFLMTPNTTTATNGATLALVGSAMVVTSYGSAADGTNTVSLPNPEAQYQLYLLMNSTASTNLLAVAKSGTFAGPALQLAAGETALIYAVGTNNWVGIGQ